MRRVIGILAAAGLAVLSLAAAARRPTDAVEPEVLIRVTAAGAQLVHFKIAYWSDQHEASGGAEHAVTPFETRVRGRAVHALIVARPDTADFLAEIIAPAEGSAPAERARTTAHGAALLYRFPERIGTAGF